MQELELQLILVFADKLTLQDGNPNELGVVKYTVEPSTSVKAIDLILKRWTLYFIFLTPSRIPPLACAAAQRHASRQARPVCVSSSPLPLPRF